MKIDTQGMSYGTGKGGKTLEEQRASIPDVQPKVTNLLSDALRAELKVIQRRLQNAMIHSFHILHLIQIIPLVFR